MKMNRVARAKGWVLLSLICGLLASAVVLGNQARADSVVAIVADAQGLTCTAYEDLPAVGGTFWIVRNTLPCLVAPLPCRPLTNCPIYAINDHIFLVDETAGPFVARRASTSGLSSASIIQAQAAELVNFIGQQQARDLAAETTLSAKSRTMNMAGALAITSDSTSVSTDGLIDNSSRYGSNILWLEITNVSNGWAYLNLHNGTNRVYAIWSTTNLLTSWQVEAEVWPTNAGSESTVTPFSVQNLDRRDLFLRAQDWTGVDSDGDGVPDWWNWEYFGTINVASTNLDFSGSGNTFAQDYFSNIPPMVFNFNGILASSEYVNSSSVAVQLDVAGYPYYITVLVDDTNFDNATWTACTTTNIVLNLGLAEGWHEVWIGLRGFAEKPRLATWQWRRFKVDTTPPSLVITGPTNGVVDTPMIQLTGYSLEDLRNISFDLTNAAGLLTNQQISVTDRFFDSEPWEFTTNTLQGYDVFLTNGVNTITIRATDLAGNITTLVTNFTLDYSGKTNPPAVQLTWPLDGTLVTGNSFTLDGQLADPTARVSASITDTNGNAKMVAGLVERTGKFWVQNLPLSAGANALTLTVVDVVGNTTVTNISLVQSPLTLTLDPVADPQQLWQPTINLTGTISDPTHAVWVNGVKGTNNGNGTWSAGNVPVDSGGTASFTITGYSPDETQPDGSHGN